MPSVDLLQDRTTHTAEINSSADSGARGRRKHLSADHSTLLDLDAGDIVRRLQVHPERCSGVQVATETDSRFCGDGPLTTEDRRDPIRWYPQRECQLVRTEFSSFKLSLEKLPRVVSESPHS